MRTLHNFKALTSNSGLLMFFVNLFLSGSSLVEIISPLLLNTLSSFLILASVFAVKFYLNFMEKIFGLSHVSLMLLQSRVVIVQGLPQNATEDTVLNYFENSRRSGGGVVEEVKIKGNVARVLFESSEGNCIAFRAV